MSSSTHCTAVRSANPVAVGGMPICLRVPDVSVAEDGAADPGIARADRDAALLRQQFGRAGATQGAEWILVLGAPPTSVSVEPLSDQKR